METLSLPMTKQNGFKTTAGLYPNDVLQREVADWIWFCLQTRHDTPLSRPLTVHIDELLGGRVDRESLISVSFRTFRVLIEQLEVMGVPDIIMPSLYIPLECADVLIAGPFHGEMLRQQINDNEPPSLYLTERALQMKLRRIEEYIFPLQASDFLENPEDVYVHYSTTRTQEDIKNNWEYGRNIVAEYYPQSYQMP